MKDEKKSEASKKDVIEIPIGKYMNALRSNPWMPATFVLAIALVVVLLVGSSGGSSVNSVDSDIAAENLISFINSQGNGNADLVSVEEKEGFYQVTVKYQEQDIPVFVTLDGQYLVSDKVPLTGAVVDSGDSAGAGGTGARKDVEEGDGSVLGKADAPVVMIEFSDYECPFCGRHFTDTYPQLKKDYIDTGKVKLVFRDFPLSFHAKAQKAAEAARCVGEQKGDIGYFKMHDKLFSNQASLSVENYKKWAKELGVNAVKFDDCLDSGKFAQAVEDSLAYGQSVGVSGTPGFFINGV